MKIFIIILLVNNLFAAYTKLGKAGMPFLKIGVGRACGMGEAFVAIADDASASYFNPAGLALLKNRELLLSHNEWLLTSRLEYLSLAYPTNLGTLGLSITSLSYGEFEETTIDNYQGTGRTFSAGDIALAISFARMFTDKFAFGGNLKFLQERIWDLTASALALDLGTYYNTGWRNLRLAMTIANFGPDASFSGKQLDTKISKPEDWTWPWTITPIPVTYKTERFILPTIFRFGTAYDFLNTEMIKLTGAADLVHYNDLAERINLGFELSIYDYYLRFGYSLSTDLDYQRALLFRYGLSGGIGFRYQFPTGIRAQLDYVIRDMGRLGLSHRINLNLGF
jgi:hypothetical protein